MQNSILQKLVYQSGVSRMRSSYDIHIVCISMSKKALITGISGQDGCYLSKFLLGKWYEVFGMMRKWSQRGLENIQYMGIADQIQILYGDMHNEQSIITIIQTLQPDEVYNFAAQSFVWVSREIPQETMQTNSMWVVYLLDAIKKYSPHTKFYQASTSELFGNSNENGLQTEETVLHPKSPYAISKLAAYWMTNNYRESYGIFACNGILFNHESPIRWKEFITRKISDGVARISLWLLDHISLWNIESRRDRWFAWDYVEAMWLMMQQEKSDNYILSTGQTHSIKEFLNEAFAYVGIQDREKYIIIDPKFFRPAELQVLEWKSDKAQRVLWRKPKVTFSELVKMMVQADIDRLRI